MEENKKEWFNQSVEEIKEKLKVEETQGLSEEQVAKNREIYGLNELATKKQKSLFVKFLEQIQMSEMVSMTALRRLVKIYNETDELTKFIKKLVYEFEPKIDQLIAEQNDEIAEEMLSKVEGANRPLFSEETTRKIMAHIHEDPKVGATNIE